MSTRPVMVTSRRRQRELLASWRTWALTSILRDPAEVARVREASWAGTHHQDPGTGERIVGNAEGLGFGVDESWHNPREVIAWTDVEAIAKAVPGEVREQLVEFGRRMGEHRKAFPRFAASAEAVGCGPIVDGQPLTERQEAYVRELEAFDASGVEAAWKKKAEALEAERFTLHDRALAADLDQEPGDLLELLDEQALGLAGPVAPDGPVAVIGEGRTRISAAELRRGLPVGARIQVFYLGGQREQTEPDVRTVTKQTSYEMVSTPIGATRGSHLAWAGIRAERDSAGHLIVRDADGTPVVAYKPLGDGPPRPAKPPIDPALALRYRDARTCTDPSELDQIAHSGIPLNRRTVAENAAASASTLERLAADEEVKVRRAVARNPHTPAVALDRLADDLDEATEVNETRIRWAVANNPGTAAEALARLAEDTDPMVLAAIGRHPHASAVVLEQLATTPVAGRSWVDPEVRHAVASNPNTPPAILARWENADGNTMAAVARNPATPADVLERLSRDSSTGNHLRAIVATNPALPAEALYRLAHEDSEVWVREHAARNPNIDAADSHRVARDSEPKVRRALARNVSVDPEVLTRLQADPDVTVREGLAKNPSISSSTLQALLVDADPRVKQACEQNASALERAAANARTPARPALRPPAPTSPHGREAQPQAPIRTGMAR